MTLRPPVHALIACLVFLACDAGTDDASRPEAQGLTAIVDGFLIDGQATPAAIKSVDGRQVERAPDNADQGIGLNWTVDPSALQVFRSTAIHLKVTSLPAGHESATCAWNFGDGSPVGTGCTVSHTYQGGRADQVATLTLTDG